MNNESYRWIPGNGVSLEAVERMRRHFPRPAEPMSDLFACPVSPATIQRAVKVCSHNLMRYEYRLKAAVRESVIIGVDETGIRINGEIAWVHLARADSLTHLVAHSKRGRQAIEDIGIINRFTGVLVRDGWQPYERL